MSNAMRGALRSICTAFVFCATTVSIAQSQQSRDTSSVLPRDVAREVVSLFNATTVLRAVDRTTVDSAQTIHGDVAVLNGPVMLSGHVTGRVLAINSDVVLQRGARIDGDLLIVGGEVEGLALARIGGETRIYHPPLLYSQSGDQLVAEAPEGVELTWWRRWERRGRSNYNRLEVATAGVYNRVEGLPIRLGPVLYRDQGWGHLRLDATAIVRTGSSFSGSTADVGSDVHGEIRIGREYGATLGARLFDVVDGVEVWQLSDAEVGLASFLLHRDYRDYFRRHGGSISAALRATDDADLTLSYSDARWSSLPTRNPFALDWNDISWRDNPLLDAGHFHVANLTLRVDTRNDQLNPWAGWYVLADYERGTGYIDALGPGSNGIRNSSIGPTRYQRGFLDLRRYNRLGPSAALNLRGVIGGWMSGDPLPLERRLSIDGPGTVPGFDFRTFTPVDVGTCSIGIPPPGRPAQCERIALMQLEFRNDLHISASRIVDGVRENLIRADGAWVFFADAGRGWTVNAPGSPLNYGRHDLPPLSTYRTDIGGGLDFGEIGIYAAKALSTPEEPLNVFLRVRHRF
jgi:hypothetical protein